MAKYMVNPLVRALFRLGVPAPGTAILETIGRNSGRPRWTPVTNGLAEDTFWIVTEHGRRSNYVRNIEANPRVRVRIGRDWRTGTARALPDDDPRERQRRLPNRVNSAAVRVMGSDLLTVRVDLDPKAGPEAAAPSG
jgi:deazaflavin-dependent oxidoreductase (nitroreductase family)